MKKPYIVSELPKDKGVYYCHNRKFPNMPVFGSIGSKQKAIEVCKHMNEAARGGKS